MHNMSNKCPYAPRSGAVAVTRVEKWIKQNHVSALTHSLTHSYYQISSTMDQDTYHLGGSATSYISLSVIRSVSDVGVHTQHNDGDM